MFQNFFWVKMFILSRVDYLFSWNYYLENFLDFLGAWLTVPTYGQPYCQPSRSMGNRESTRPFRSHQSCYPSFGRSPIGLPVESMVDHMLPSCDHRFVRILYKHLRPPFSSTTVKSHLFHLFLHYTLFANPFLLHIISK